MAHKKIIILFLILGGVISFFVGCSPITEFQPSSTPENKTTHTIPVPTITNTRTPTSTPIHTLSPDDAYARLYEMLNTDTSCKLPCWMGITPGQSTLSEVNMMLPLFRGIASEWFFIGDILDGGSFADLTILNSSDNVAIEISQSFDLKSDNDVISLIGIWARAYKLEDGIYVDDVYGYPAYNEFVQRYTLARVFVDYGMPEKIYILGSLRGDTVETPGFGDRFFFYIFYPPQGIFLKYGMLVKGVEENYQLCPSAAAMEGILLSPVLSKDYQNVLVGWQALFSPQINIKTTEEAFGMTDEEFYESFKSSPEVCLETPKEIWWPEGSMP